MGGDSALTLCEARRVFNPSDPDLISSMDQIMKDNSSFCASYCFAKASVTMLAWQQACDGSLWILR